MDGRNILGRFQEAKAHRLTLDDYYDDCFRFTYPMRGLGFTNKQQDGLDWQQTARDRRARLYDSTSTDSLRLLASSMQSGLTPANSNWFELGIKNEDIMKLPLEVRRWLDNVQSTMHSEIHNSNFDAEAFEFFLDMAIAGTAGLYCDMNDEGELIFEFWNLADSYIASTYDKSRIDTVFRELNLTATQYEKMFGKIPDFMQHAAGSTGKKQKFTVVHAILPRLNKKGKQVKGKTRKNMPFASVYVDTEGTILKESGYHEFPVAFPRWLGIPKSDYAVGPLDGCLPDVKTLNRVKEIVLISGENSIAGTLVVGNDALLNNNTVRIGPRKVIRATNVDNIKPLKEGSDYKIAEWLIGQLQESIRRVLMTDQLQPSDKPYSTATEVQVRVQILRRLLGPVYSRFEPEFLQVIVNRVYGLLLRAGKFGLIPQILDGYEMDIQYQSPLARAQKLEDVEQISQFEQLLIQKAQVDPTVLDVYDAEAAAIYEAKIIGVPNKLLRSEDEIKKIRKKRQDEQQALQEQALAAQAQGQGGPPTQ